jgi:RNA polymerase sigma-70 factor, ECF subfamily
MTTTLAQIAGDTAARDDLDLVHATQNGDLSAFDQLVKRYDRKLFRIAQHVTHNQEDSQDVVQEAFLKAFQHLADFREDSQFSTWLIRITLNQSFMKLRKLRTAKETSLDNNFESDADMPPMEVVDWAPNPEQLYGASELRDILVHLLEELRPGLRAVFVLRDMEGFSIDQTAEALNVSQAAVKARLFRARLQLRGRLNKYFNQPHGSTGVESSSYKCILQATPRSHSLPGNHCHAT